MADSIQLQYPIVDVKWNDPDEVVSDPGMSVYHDASYIAGNMKRDAGSYENFWMPSWMRLTTTPNAKSYIGASAQDGLFYERNTRCIMIHPKIYKTHKNNKNKHK